MDVVAVRREVAVAFDRFQAAKAGGAAADVAETLRRLEHAIGQSRSVAAKIDELALAFDQIRRLAETETKRVVLAREMLTRGQAQLFASLVQEAVRHAVDGEIADPGLRRRVLAAFTDNLTRAQAGGFRS